MEPLTNPQVRKLKALAQRLECTLHVGKQGLSEAFIRTLHEALDHHELVKVKFADFKDQRKQLAPEMALKTNSHLVWLIGHVAVLYREQTDPEKRKIRF